MANRGYIFEAVWAAAVAARFHKRIGNIENINIRNPQAFQKSAAYRIQLGILPAISNKDTQDMFSQFFPRIPQLN